MLKQNDAIRKLLNVDVWHKAGFTGKNIHAVILDWDDGKPRAGTESYLTDVFGKSTESGHAANVAQTIREIIPDTRISYFDNTRNKDAVFKWVRDNKDNIDIINVSLAGLRGMTTDDYLRYQALGIPMICASGNDGYDDQISYPANYEFTIAIGSSDKYGDKVDIFSNGGPMLNAVCPDHIAIINSLGDIWTPSGTSYASPVAAGLIGIYCDFRKVSGLDKLTEDIAILFVNGNSEDILAEGFDNESGYGRFHLPSTIPILATIPIPAIPEPIIVKEILTMPKIYISPSSQEQNKGLSPFSTEAIEMNEIVDLLVPLLINDGRFIVKRNTPFMGVYQMAADSNSFNADLHAAIHSNAGGGVGTEVYAYGPNTNSEILAKSLYNQIAPLSPGADRGVKYNKNLYEVGDRVNATAALIELGFHDNQADATWLAYNHEMIADRLYRGICDYYSYDYKAIIVKPPIAPPTPPTVDNKTKAISLIEQAIALLEI